MNNRNEGEHGTRTRVKAYVAIKTWWFLLSFVVYLSLIAAFVFLTTRGL